MFAWGFILLGLGFIGMLFVPFQAQTRRAKVAFGLLLMAMCLGLLLMIMSVMVFLMRTLP